MSALGISIYIYNRDGNIWRQSTKGIDLLYYKPKKHYYEKLKFVAFATLLTFLFISCEKEDTAIRENSSPADSEVVILKEGGIGPYREYIPDNGEGKPVCEPNVVDCFPIDITIFPVSHVNVFESIFQSINDGKSAVKLFENNRDMLLNYGLDEDLVDDYIDGNNSLEAAEYDNFHYLRFVDSSGANLCVYPFKY